MEEVRYCQSCGAYLPKGQKKCLACDCPIEVTKAECDADTIETTTLEDGTYMVYVNGVPLQSFRVGKKENVLDLYNPRITVLCGGVAREATIVHKLYQRINCAGRDIGRMDKHLRRGVKDGRKEQRRSDPVLF